MSRELPKAIEIEASLLGTLLVYPETTAVAMDQGLEEDDFFLNENKAVYRAIKKLYDNNQTTVVSSVANILREENMFTSIGGMPYLLSLGNASESSQNVLEYVNLLHDKQLLRKMILTAEKVVDSGYKGGMDTNAFLDMAEKDVLSVSRDRRSDEFVDPVALIDNTMKKIEEYSKSDTDITGLKTGLTDLDHLLHGLQRGDLIILAARPSMGKTAVALNLAMNVAKNQPDEAVAVFSLEMPAEQLQLRILSAKSRVEGDKVRTGKYMSSEDWSKLYESAAQLKRLRNIYIDEKSNNKIAEIFSKCRRLKSEHGLSLVVLDYIQLLSDRSRSNGSREQEVAEYSRALKSLARELEVPVIALSQLSRNVESRPDKRPMLSDLRESGAIEQDADVVMLLYRDSYYNEEKRTEANETGYEKLEINVAKHRNGAIDRLEVVFEKNTNAIFNLTTKE